MDRPPLQSQDGSYSGSFATPATPGTPASTLPLLSANSLLEHESSDKEKAQGRFSKPNVERNPPNAFKKLFLSPPKLRAWWYRKLTFRVWWLEIICCLVTLGSLAALVATLSKFDGKPLPQWPLRLSVNVIVSICVSSLRTAAAAVLSDGISHLKWIALSSKKPISLERFSAYDAASRGASGSLTLIWKLRLRDIISTTGAILTIFLLAAGPFGQRIVEFGDCERVVLNETAYLPRAQIYDVAPSGLDANQTANALRTGLRSALINGLFTGPAPLSTWVCPTGNCTFEEASTIGYCSLCSDLSSTLIKSKVYEDEEKQQWVDFALKDPEDILTRQDEKHGGTDNFTLRYSITQRKSEYFKDTSEFFYVLPNVYDVWEISHERLPEMVMIRPNTTALTLEETEATAYKCSLQPCGRSFKAEIANGRLQERYITASQIAMGQQRPSSLVDLRCLELSDEKLQMLRKLGYDLESDKRWLRYNVSIVASGNAHSDGTSVAYENNPGHGPIADEDQQYYEKDAAGEWRLTSEALEIVPSDCMYQLTRSNTIELWDLVLEIFNGTVKETRYSDNTLAGLRVFTGPGPAMALFQAGSGQGYLEDIEALMQNVSDSLTAYIRQHGNPDFHTSVRGEMSQHTTCIDVSWRWVLVLGAFVLVLHIYLIAVMMRARQAQYKLIESYSTAVEPPTPHDFKDSPLPLLFHGLESSSLEKIPQVDRGNRMNDLERLADEVHVTLVPTDEGWKMKLA